MTEGVRFSVSLEDHVSPAAKTAAKGLKELQNELSASKSKLALYQQQLSHAKQLGDVEGYRTYSKLVAQARRETFELGDAIAKAGGPLRELGEKAKRAAPEVTQSLQGAVPAAGEASGAIEALGGALEALPAVAAAAGVAVVGVLAAIAVKGVESALKVSEFNEQLSATFGALGGGQQSGAATLAFFDKLSSSLPQSREQLAEWAKQFEALGYTDLSSLKGQIRAVAAAQAIGGSEAVTAYTTITERVRVAIDAHQKLKLQLRSLAELRRTGVGLGDIAGQMHTSVEALSASLKAGTVDAQQFGNALSSAVAAKGVKPLKAMGNSIDSLMSKGKEVFEHLFDGLDTSPITDGIRSFIHLGDQGTASGKVLKKGITSAIQGIINWIGKMMTEGEVMFLTLELYALKHRSQLKLIEKGFGAIGDAIVKVTHGIEWLFAHEPPPWLTRLALGTSTFGLSEVAIGATKYAKGHAEGGIVQKPAAGEYFASVAPGEMILPKRESRELMGGGLGPAGRMMMPANTNANGGPGGGVHIDRLELNIHAPQGVTDAHQISATSLALALERYQLAGGR